MLYTFEAGHPSGPTIVFLHGGGLSSRSWYPVVDLLPEFHCLAPDLPGHGRSANAPFTLRGSAGEVATIIREKCPNQRAHLVGLSLSGAVIFTLLNLTPEVADHVVVTGSSGRLPRWLVNISLPFLSVMRFMKPATLVRSTLRQNGIPDKYSDLLCEDLIIGSRMPFLHQMYSELTTLEFPPDVPSPLLVCVGQKEPGAARLYGQISLGPLRRYRSAQGVAMPGGHHAWPLQFPEHFAHTVRAWVMDQPLPAVLRRLKA